VTGDITPEYLSDLEKSRSDGAKGKEKPKVNVIGMHNTP